MATFNELKINSINKGLSDTELLMDFGLLDNITPICEGLFGYKLRTSSSEPLSLVFADLKKELDEATFRKYFEGFDSIAEKIWNGDNYSSIIGALCRKTIQIVSAKAPNDYLKTFLIEELNFVPADIPFGKFSILSNFRINRLIDKLPEINSLRVFRDLLEKSTDFVSSYGDFQNSLQALGLPTEFMTNRERSYYNAVMPINGIDKETKSNYVANINDGGVFYLPIDMLAKFRDTNAKEYFGKSFNVIDSPYPSDNDINSNEVFIAQTDAIRDAFKKYEDNAYWDLSIDSFKIKNLIETINGSCLMSAKTLDVKHKFPVELTIPDSAENNYKFVFSNVDLLHFAALITKISKSDTVSIKANIVTKELIIISDMEVPNSEEKMVNAFALLSPFNSDKTYFLDSYQGVDFREFQASAVIRERERVIKKVFDFPKLSRSLVESVKAKKLATLAPSVTALSPVSESVEVMELKPQAEVEAVIKPIDELAREYSPEFYQTFLNVINDYVSSYTKLEEFIDSSSGSKKIVRVPIVDDFKKDSNGAYLLRKEEKILDFNYIYTNREAFWVNNGEFKVEELIAFFVSRGADANYRKLSIEILGQDCFKYEENLIDDLIKVGYLAVESIDLDITNKRLKSIKYSYHADYANGGYYDKIEKIRGRVSINGDDKTETVSRYSREKTDTVTQFSHDIISYFGQEFGTNILDKQADILDAHRNKPLTFLVEDESNKLNQLEISVDNSTLWTNERFLDRKGWAFDDTANTRMPIVSKSTVLTSFYEWLQKNRTNPSLLEFKNDIQELFDAAVVPMDDVTYIEEYVIPHWLVRTVDENGIEKQEIHPLNFGDFTYTIKNPKKGEGQPDTIEVTKSLRFTVSDISRWDGDNIYKKDMRPETGAYEEFKYRGKETKLKVWAFNNSLDGRTAKRDWDKVVKGLMKSVVDPYNKRKSKATRVCNFMFNLYLQKHIALDKRVELEEYWNKKYNAYILPKYERFPIFARHAKYFGKSEQPFVFKPSQVEGIRSYISRGNSIVLGHETGFGKTSSSIGIMNHLFNTGEASRVLLCVPNVVYDKWRKETIGDDTFKGLMPFVNVVDLYNAAPTSLMKLKTYTEREREIIIAFKAFKKDYDAYIKLLQEKTFNIHVNTPAEIIVMLEKSIHDHASHAPLADFKEEVEFLWKYFKKKLDDSIFAETQRITNRVLKEYKELGLSISDEDRKKKIDDPIARFTEKRTNDINKELTIETAAVVLFRLDSLADDLGAYKPEVLRNRTIVLCSHEAIGKLRGSLRGGMESLSIIDDAFNEVQKFIPSAEPTTATERLREVLDFKLLAPISNATKKSRKYNPFRLPVSLNKLNVDAFIVDEVHEDNTIVTGIRKRKVVGRENPRTQARFEFGKEAIAGKSGLHKAVLQYFSRGHGQRNILSVNALAVARSIQTKNRANKKQNNTLLLSATPFTDSPIFQMISVFAILNYELLQKINLSSTWDIFNEFASEEWKLDLTHDGRIGNFPTVDKYKNIFANSNLLNLFVNFKISDPEVEKLRPKKFVIPDQKLLLKDILPDVPQLNSYVPMNDLQLAAKAKILQYLHGEITFGELFNEDYKKAKEESEEIDEETEIKVADEASLLAIKDIEIGQIVFREDTKTYWELINIDPTTITSWDELGATRDAKAEDELIDVAVEEGEMGGGEEEPEAVDVYGGNAEESLEKGNWSKEDQTRGTTIVAMGADMNISVSPYFGNISLPLPALSEFEKKTKKLVYLAKNFVESSPKFLYTIECVKSVIDYHKANGQKVSGQIIYINRDSFYFMGVKYSPLDLIKQYIAEREDIDITADEIGIIRGSTSRIKRQEIQDGFNSGKYKILIGTAAIEQGVDLQENTSVMYVLTANYVPSRIIQLEGRPWRQGNIWANIRIVYVMTYGSLDGFQFSKVNQKITQIKIMLESAVFDMNETQFDKDFNKIKLELETDIKKKALLLYEIQEEDFRDEFTRSEARFNSLSVIKDNYYKYKEGYDQYIERLNFLGKELNEIAFEEVKQTYLDTLRNKKHEEQNATLIRIVEQENIKIDKQNQEHLEKAELAVTATKNILDKAKADLSTNKVPIKALETALKEKEAFAKKPLVNLTMRNEIIANIKAGLRETFAKEREAINAPDEDVIKYAEYESRGDNKDLFRFKFNPLTTKSSYSDINSSVNKIKDFTRRAFGAQHLTENSDLFTEEQLKNSISHKKRTAFVRAGYEKEFNLDDLFMETYGKSSGRNNYTHDEFEHFVAEVESFDFKAKKGAIIKDFVEHVGDETLIDSMIEDAMVKRNESKAKLENRQEEINRITETLEQQEAVKKSQGSYDIMEQVKKFARTNVLLTLRPI